MQKNFSAIGKIFGLQVLSQVLPTIQIQDPPVNKFLRTTGLHPLERNGGGRLMDGITT